MAKTNDTTQGTQGNGNAPTTQPQQTPPEGSQTPPSAPTASAEPEHTGQGASAPTTPPGATTFVAVPFAYSPVPVAQVKTSVGKNGTVTAHVGGSVEASQGSEG